MQSTRNRTLRRAASVLALTLGVAAATPAAAERYAVLVGVTKYPNLAPKNWLVGPANDAALMRDFLVGEAGFDRGNITVLADDAPDAQGSPTHDAIRTTLKAVAEKAGKDDFVYLHFGGHGFQQPALDPASETDGKDEIFLPADVKLPGDDKRLPNAYIDDEVKADLDAIRATGAFVWVVFDACHSSTATRAAFGGDEAERKIDWEDLGVEAPKYAEEGSRAIGGRENALSAEETSAEGAGKGGLVAFYAAQTVETTPEMPLPPGVEGAPRQGLFSYTIARELAANPNVTYRQLGEAVLQAYSGLNRTKPTPMFEGDLDKQVFNNADQERVLQWKVDAASGKPVIPAGALHRIAPGAKLAILARPGDKDEDALGFVAAATVTNFSSTLTELAASDPDAGKAIRLADVPKDAFARLAETPVDFTLSVARADDGAHPAEAAALNARVEKLAADGEAPINIRVVDSAAAADIRLAVLSERDIDETAAGDRPLAWFLPPSGEV
ncbi:MAG: caspase family protein, partial [Rhizobiaceae bacterium]